jgi:hypothetical protein
VDGNRTCDTLRSSSTPNISSRKKVPSRIDVAARSPSCQRSVATNQQQSKCPDLDNLRMGWHFSSKQARCKSVHMSLFEKKRLSFRHISLRIH